MEFCPTCGKRLIPRPRAPKALYCKRCGYESELVEGKLSTTSGFADSANPGIVVLDRKTLNLRVYPLVNVNCPKCASKRAETWSRAVGSEEVAGITYYRCVSCRYTWRETE